MRILIRFVESRGVGQEVQETVFDGSVATFGRGADQTIQISDRHLPLNHSELSLSRGKLTLAVKSDLRFSVNGRMSKQAVLTIGDEVDISGHKIKFLPGEGEAEFILEVELKPEQVEELRDRFTTRLHQVNLPERQLSWLLFLLILAIGLAIPGLGLLIGMERLRDSPLPDDGIWLTGKLHSSHAFMGDDCTYCHTRAFTPTRDEDCLFCHLSVNHHFDTEVLGGDYRIGESCGDCHKEHSITNSITRSDQEVCTGCHADLPGMGFETTRLESATDFLDDHPTFKVTMQAFEDDHQWHWRRFEVRDRDVSEQSNLIFPHNVHLAEQGVNSADGTVVMSCSDCHQSEKGGLRMQAVTMERHCAKCHQLTFDPSTPDRVVPHGSPTELMRMLREYYAYRFLQRDEPERESTLIIPENRSVRRPGQISRSESISDLIAESFVDRSDSLSQQARAYVASNVAEAAANLFEKRTCTICHEINRVDNQVVPWQVLPVLLNRDWMPLAEFSHDRHQNMQCGGCHDAIYSTESGEILMPDIGACWICHGGEHAEDMLQSNCITCHGFHLESQRPMGELIAVDDIEIE